MSANFLLDEQLPKWWKREIVSLQPALTVWRVGDPQAPPLSTPDKQLLEWCEENDFYLLTNNRSTMPEHMAKHVSEDRHVPGIFHADAGMKISVVSEELSLIAGATFEGEFQDQILYLPLP